MAKRPFRSANTMVTPGVPACVRIQHHTPGKKRAHGILEVSQNWDLRRTLRYVPQRRASVEKSRVVAPARQSNLLLGTVLEFGVCLCPASAGEQVPHLPETVLKMAGHGEAVRVWAAVPGADSHNNLVLPGSVTDSKAVLPL